MSELHYLVLRKVSRDVTVHVNYKSYTHKTTNKNKLKRLHDMAMECTKKMRAS